jgi:hypothetical protein
MSNIVKFVFVICIAFGAYKFWGNEGAQNTKEWVSYEFNLEDVEVKFPVTPLVDKQDVQGFQIEMARARKYNSQYIISILKGKDLSASDYYPSSLINKGASIESSKDIIVNGFIGKEYNLKLNGQLVTQRFIEYNGSLLNQLIIHAPDSDSKSESKSFFESLVIKA